VRDQHALIVGQSHANALRNAARNYVPTHPNFSLQVAISGARSFPGGLVLHTVGGQPMANPVIMATVERSMARGGRDLWVVSLLGVNYANRLALLRAREPFDFVLPGREDLPLDREARSLPFDVVADAMRAMMESLAGALTALSRLPIAGVIQIEGPGPIRDSALLASSLPPRTVEAARRLGVKSEEIVISPPSLRLKTWLLQCRLMRELCAKAGVTYMPAPASMNDAEGYRLPGTLADAIHANGDYAMAVFADLEALITQAREVAA